MSETLTILDGILKDDYQDVVTDQVQVFDPVAEMFEKVTEVQFEGRKAVEMTNMSYNEGVGAYSEGGNLPTAGTFDPQQFNIGMKYLAASFQMTKQMMESAKTSKGAFKNAMNMSMDTVVTNLKREQARMIWGAGKGILAYVNCSGAQTTLTVDNPGGITNTAGGARYLRKNMVIGCINPSDGTLRSGTITTISAVAATGLSVTVPSTTFTENDYIVRFNTTSETAASGGGYNQEPMGLLGIVDDGTYLTTLSGLSRNTYGQLKSRVQSAVGALSLDAIQLNFDIASQAGDAEIDVLAGHHSVRRAYLALLEADRRYSGSDLQSPDGGTKAASASSKKSYVTFGGKPMIESKNAPYGMLFGLDKSKMKKYSQVEGEWANDSGAILTKTSGKDVWEAFYRRWLNYHCSKPSTCFRMDGISVNNVYVPSY
jgi:hypothetical protein